MRFAIVAAVLLAVPSGTALAQTSPSEADEAQATQLRQRAQRAVAEGRFEDAFTALAQASARTADPGVWLEVADVADRLRMNERALEALGRYLTLREDAPDRDEIEARIRVLRQVLEGARYVEAEGGTSVRLIHDWEGEPSLPSAPGQTRPGGANILVDWAGRPLEGRRTRDMLALADWDGVIRGEGPEEPNAPPPPGDLGLGRRLATP